MIEVFRPFSSGQLRSLPSDTNPMASFKIEEKNKDSFVKILKLGCRFKNFLLDNELKVLPSTFYLNSGT